LRLRKTFITTLLEITLKAGTPGYCDKDHGRL
jgi:hypothetical protein